MEEANLAKVLVLFGSETGTSEDLARTLFDRLRRLKFEPILLPFGLAGDRIASADYIFIVCSTSGQGELPLNAQNTWRNLLLKKSLPQNMLRNTFVAVFGLGDSSYPRYNWAGRKISVRLAQLGACELVPRGESDRMSPDPERSFYMWLDLVSKTLQGRFNIDETPADVLLNPYQQIKLLSEKKAETDIPWRVENLKVASNRRITAANHFLDVRNLVLEQPQSWNCEPGDTVAIFPPNAAEYVEAVMKHQEWHPDQLVKLPTSFLSLLPASLSPILSLRELLTWVLDLNDVPKRSFFELAKHFCTGREAAKMSEFASVNGTEELYNYSNRPRRSLAETICEFETLKIPLEYLLDILPVISPRFFSVASQSASGPCELCVSIVKYRTILRRLRKGLCSRFVENLDLHQNVPMQFIRRNLNIMRKLGNRPAILIATGTGISLIRRILYDVPKDYSNKVFLFYGCRGADDFLYADEWKQIAAHIDLQVITAFSREGQGYVQQQIERSSIAPYIENALIVVCGSSNKMPNTVRSALVDVLERAGYKNPSECIENKQKQGFYIQETW